MTDVRNVSADEASHSSKVACLKASWETTSVRMTPLLCCTQSIKWEVTAISALRAASSMSAPSHPLTAPSFLPHQKIHSSLLASGTERPCNKRRRLFFPLSHIPTMVKFSLTLFLLLIFSVNGSQLMLALSLPTGVCTPTSPEGREEKQLLLKSSTSVHAGTWVPTQSSRARGASTR